MSTLPLGPPTAAPPTDNPFPGLRPFQPGEEHLFFGREHQIDAMVDKLARTRFLSVIGTSGSGKSSLVNCGLRPALHRGLMTSAGPAWRVVYFRPGGSPIRALAHALAREGSLYGGYDGEVPLTEVIETYLRMSSRGLVDVVRRAGLPARTNLLLVADQFEELFRYRNLRAPSDDDAASDNEEATALVNLLLEAVRHPAPIYVVLTMRSDFLGDCAHFHGLPEAMNEAQYLVPRLSRDERRAAIAGPITLADAEPHPALLTRLVNDVGDNPDQLSILQHALNRTWARWRVRGDADRPIVIDDYTDIGTMAGALDRHAEKAFAEVGDDRRKIICERMFRTLTDRGTDARGIRRPTTLRRLCAIVGASREELVEVIDVFRKPSRSFLMPPLAEPLELDTVIDLSHESLMRVWRRLEAWTDKESASARMWRRLTESAALHAEGKASLWRDPELQIAAEWRSEQRPTREWAELYDSRFELAMAFLDRSLEARALSQAEQEIRRRWLRIRVTLLTLAAVVSLLAFAEVYPEVHSALTAPQGSGFGETLETAWKVAPAVALMVLALAGPLLLVFLSGEYIAKPLYREHRFASIARQMAARAEASGGGYDVEGLKVEPDVRWQTQYATTWRRAVAFVLDGLIAIVLLLVAMTMAAIVEGTSADVPMADLWVTIGMVGGVILGWLYQARTVASKHRATYGMRAVHVFVVDIRGEPLTFARATLRHACKAFNLVYGLGLVMQPFMPRRQTLHDWLSGSVVLSEPASTPPTGAPRTPIAMPVHDVRLPQPGGRGPG